MNVVSNTGNSTPTAAESASAKTGDAPFSVNFGDGTSAAGPYMTKTFTAIGNFTTTLTVTDDDGVTAMAATNRNGLGHGFRYCGCPNGKVLRERIPQVN